MDLLNSYQFVYDETVKLIAETSDEIPWDCSTTYVFGEGDTFLQRLEWVRSKECLTDASHPSKQYKLIGFQIKDVVEKQVLYKKLDVMKVDDVQRIYGNIKASCAAIGNQSNTALDLRHVFVSLLCGVI